MAAELKKVKYLILGAGPAGLTFANCLKKRGEDSFLVLEKEEEAGGLCRSAMVDGSPFDTGGGHFLDVKRPWVNEFLFQFLPEEEWNLFQRDSRIDLKGTMVGHPLEANIWQLDLEEQVAYLSSIAKAGCNSGESMPEKFTDWIGWKLGDKIAKDYMLPYNRKMFADELNELGTYWLDKLPDVSFEETLRSCLTRKPCGTQPGHAQFYYPKRYGYGELWRRMAEKIAPHMRYQAGVVMLDCDRRRVKTDAGEIYEAEMIITTIPWKEFQHIEGMPVEIKESIEELKHSAIETRYLQENPDTPAHWIYVPDPEVPWHRILVRHNFCPGSRGCWLETRQERTKMYAQEEDQEGGNAFCFLNRYAFCFLNRYAYPLNTINKPEIMKDLLSYCAAKHIYGLGRWGEHSHYNSDVVAEKAMKLAEQLCS